jgi:hypothetical protein
LRPTNRTILTITPKGKGTGAANGGGR